MSEVALLRVENVALAAESKAVDAKHTAERAMLQQSAHEAVCSERYSNITQQLNALPEVYKAINDLRAVANKAIGVWLGIAGIAIICGTIYTVMKLTHGE